MTTVSCFPFLFQQQALAGALVAGAGSVGETDPFKRQQAGTPAGTSWSTGPSGLRGHKRSGHMNADVLGFADFLL